MIYTIDEIKNLVKPIIEKYKISSIYLFGSYAKGTAGEESDIDFLIDTTGSKITSLLDLGAMYCDLEDTFKKNIDLLTLGALMQPTEMQSDLEFRSCVLKERIVLNDVA